MSTNESQHARSLRGLSLCLVAVTVLVCVLGGVAFSRQKKWAKLEEALIQAGDAVQCQGVLAELVESGDEEASIVLKRFAERSNTRCWIPEKRLFIIDRPEGVISTDLTSKTDVNPHVCHIPCLVGFTPIVGFKGENATGFPGLSQTAPEFLEQKDFFHAGVDVLRIQKIGNDIALEFTLSKSWTTVLRLSSKGPYRIQVPVQEIDKLFPEQNSGASMDRMEERAPDLAIREMRFWFEAAGILPHE